MSKLKHYETMFILKPTLTDEETAAQVELIKSTITKNGNPSVKIFNIHKPKKVVFCLGDRRLSHSVRLLCNRLGIDFIWQYKYASMVLNPVLGDRFSSFYSKCRALIYLIYYFASRWSLRSPRARNGSSSKDSVFFASYFFNLDLELAEKGSYYSRQWGDLPQFLHRGGWKTFHLEHFIKSPAIQNQKSPSVLCRCWVIVVIADLIDLLMRTCHARFF